MSQQQRPGQTQAAEVSRYLGIGLTWALSTALFLYVGRLADGRLGTEPWLTLAGALVGGVAGFWYMYHHAVVVPRREVQERRGRH